MFPKNKIFIISLVLTLFLVSVSIAFAQTPSVTVSDQPIENGTVTISSVFSNGPGWLVIHAQADGKPGRVLGHSPLVDGENSNVVVEVDEAGVTPVLYAMLHTDAGTIGTYEFPGDDGPVKVDGAVVTPPFNVIDSSAPAQLPATGGELTPWPVILLFAVGGLLLVSGIILGFRQRLKYE